MAAFQIGVICIRVRICIALPGLTQNRGVSVFSRY